MPWLGAGFLLVERSLGESTPRLVEILFFPNFNPEKNNNNIIQQSAELNEKKTP